MFKLICVTDRRHSEDFLAQLEKIAAAGIDGVILREKDLSEEAYQSLAAEVMAVTEKYGVPLTLHNFTRAAWNLNTERIHLPLAKLRALSAPERSAFAVIGASCHSAEEARAAEALGASYITAGHIYATDCKKGLPPRGTALLREIRAAVSLPVYAIGGVTPERVAELKKAGADGGCVMSALAQAEDPAALIREWRDNDV